MQSGRRTGRPAARLGVHVSRGRTGQAQSGKATHNASNPFRPDNSCTKCLNGFACEDGLSRYEAIAGAPVDVYERDAVLVDVSIYVRAFV